MDLNGVVAVVLALLTCAPWRIYSQERLLVPMTLVRNASALGAFCLDGSLPAYHLHRGFGAGTNNWLLQFEGGGWCNDIASCLERAETRRGSTRLMTKLEVFSGILSNNASMNPDFYNWNRVKLRYCDGASFAGDAVFDNGRAKDLGSNHSGPSTKRVGACAEGCSAGGLASFLHCNNFAYYLPENASVKCLSDAGFFLDERDISLNYTIRSFYKDLVSLQGVEQNLEKNCTSSLKLPYLCFFPQYALKYITAPFFILNSAYDVFQFHHILVPPSADLHGHWNHCKLNPEACDENQMETLQGFRRDMLIALRVFYRYSRRGGMFINSCFAHCQSESQDTWFGVDSPRIHNKTTAEAVGDWYFSRMATKEIDCAYPCDSTCRNLIPYA